MERLEDRLLLVTQSFNPVQDNSLFENDTGATSNGAHVGLFAGVINRSNNELRRALLAFDLSSIPAGSTVTDVRLDLTVTRNPPAAPTHDFDIHRVTESWGEGTSNATGAGGRGASSTTGDATWVHRNFNTENWATPGGSFEATVSASAGGGNSGSTTSFSGAGMVADVQAWVDGAENHGWIILGSDESLLRSARRWGSRESGTPPALEVTFDEPTPTASIAVDNESFSEGEGSSTVTASLSAAAGSDVTIELGFAGTATPTTDYTTSASEIVITAGALTGSIDVVTVDDNVDEPDETVIVTIESVSEGAEEEGDQELTITILDNDEPPPVEPDVTLGVDNTSIDEASGVATFTSTLSEVTTVPVTVEFEFAGTASAEDFVSSASQVVIAPGSTTGSITVTATQDETDEPDETVVVAIAAVINGNEVDDQEQTVTIVDDDLPPALMVNSLTPTSTGFIAEFSAELDLQDLNLFDTASAGMGPADVVVTGASSGPVNGSLVIGAPSSGAPGIEAEATTVQFIASGGPLAADVYTVTLRSAEDGFEAIDGQLLDGNGDGTGGDDLVTEFVVEEAPATARTIGLPDFVRGPGQPVNLPADSETGIPITISDGDNVRAVDLRISYDPALLEITGASAPAGGTVVPNLATPGLAIFVYFSTTSLPAGETVFIELDATVPTENAGDNYGRSHVLDVHSVLIGDGDDNDFPAVVDDAVHLVSFPADSTGNGRINAGDAADIARFAALLSTGLSGSLLNDPLLAGDVSGNGRVNAADASLVAQFAALLPVDEIPPIPAGVLIAGGPQPGVVLDTLESRDSNRSERVDLVVELLERADDPRLEFHTVVDAALAELAEDTESLPHSQSVSLEEALRVFD